MNKKCCIVRFPYEVVCSRIETDLHIAIALQKHLSHYCKKIFTISLNKNFRFVENLYVFLEVSFWLFKLFDHR